MQLDMRLDGSMEAFAEGAESLARFLREARVDEACAYHVSLVFDEVVSNAMRRASGTGRGPIEVDLRLDGRHVVLTVEDEGPPFNPLLVPEPVAPASIHEATIGGWGIGLVRMAASRIEYERDGNRNRVRVAVADERS